MIDASALHMVLAVLTGWLDRQERQALAYLMEENRVVPANNSVPLATIDLAGFRG